MWINIWIIQNQLEEAEEAEVERFYEDLQAVLELTPKKDVLFIIGDWNAKVGSQETPGATGQFCLGVQNEAGQMWIEQTHMDITRWTILKSDWLYSLQPKREKLYPVSRNKTGS